MKSIEVVAAVTQRVLVCREEAGFPRACWISQSEIVHITGIQPSFLIERIREELAMQSLVFAEVPGTGFLLIDPAKFPATDTSHLVLKPSIHHRVPLPPDASAPQGVLRSLGDLYGAGDESIER